MLQENLFRSGGLLAFLALTFCALCGGQEKAGTSEIPLWRFDELTAPGSCRMMGRFQDKEYCDSKVVDQVLALGKDAIPILISELTDDRKTKHSVYDLWKYTTAGDIANSLLSDLFTASDLTVAIMPELDPLQRDCEKPGEACWRKFLHKKGRKFVQEQWEAAWNAHKNNIYWDEKARCFRVAPVPSQSASAGNVGSPQSNAAGQN
ncbi:MAG: hypothetical protein WBR26_23155 [Candidatus Acidiferrum sp.]